MTRVATIEFNFDDYKRIMFEKVECLELSVSPIQKQSFQLISFKTLFEGLKNEGAGHLVQVFQKIQGYATGKK